MTAMIHKICGAVIAESKDPNFVPVEGMLLRSADWHLPNQRGGFRKNGPIICPKCKRQVSNHHLEFTSDQ